MRVMTEGHRTVLVQVLGPLLIAGLLGGCGSAKQSTQLAPARPLSGVPSGGNPVGLSSSGRTPPRLYHQPAFQSPVRADPDDLLVLAGDGLSANDTVIYQAFSLSNDGTMHPSSVPQNSTPDLGIADIVSAASIPLQLTIRVPDKIVAERAYRIWVRSSDDQWSNAVAINDPRPLWISPSVVYASAAQASLPRYIKVVGRNLEPRGPLQIQVRLSGPNQYVLKEPLVASVDAALQRYAATLRLPRTMIPGHYGVAVSVDGVDWVDVPGPALHVAADPSPPREFAVPNATFGACRPDDGADDTSCIQAAIAAAVAAGGGVVVLGQGTWDVVPGMIELPAGVQLRGRGAEVTRVLRHEANARPDQPVVTLLGKNEVRDIRFATEHKFAAQDSPHPILQLGSTYHSDSRTTSTAATVKDVVISNNIFDKSYGAIVDGGAPIERLFVTSNRFGDYHLALQLGGNRYNVRSRFGIADSIIAYNTFVPGSYIDSKQNQGVYASELGASSRVDFSDNDADGADRSFLNSPDDPPGWRAAFFFHMNDNHEMLLISHNTASCTGDKAGDGEAVALDNNANTFAFAAASPVLAATEDTVRIRESLTSVQNDRPIDVASYYVGHWVQIAQGPGIGQTRKILSYHTDPKSLETTFVVSPAWDVPPQPTVSIITIGREFWQVYIVGNTVDQRKPLCTKGNVTRPKGGVISVWAQSSDSVVEGNRQFDTDGILFQQAYGADERDCEACRAGTILQSFLEIRGNLIDGEYDWDSACSLSGIMGSYAAAPTLHSATPPLSTGVSISHNTITHADGWGGGAISVQPTWYRGSPGRLRPLVQNLMIHHNQISDMSGSDAHAACVYGSAPRAGIHLEGRQNLTGTSLYMNTCENVATRLIDHGESTFSICDKSSAYSCECSGAK